MEVNPGDRAVGNRWEKKERTAVKNILLNIYFKQK
jgi:hypothetical protein